MNFPPVGKVLLVCDDVVVDATSHKLTILNLWEIVRPPAGASFPYTLGKVVVAAMLRGGRGTVTFQAKIVRAETGAEIRESDPIPLRFDHPRQTRLLVLRMPDVTFPAPGEYLIQLTCEGKFVDDQTITLLPA